MNKAQYVNAILTRMDDTYGKDVRCYLTHENPWQLLIAVILSAQCTDARVNTVTPALFKRYKNAQQLADAKQEDVEEIIRPLGFFRSKAASIIGCSKGLCERFEGNVPATLDELTSLPGVGRKTANVIRGTIYGEPSVVVDTHVKRISKKFGFTKNDDPEKIEYDLMKILPKDHWISYNSHVITLGRSICTARNPKCEQCFLSDICKSAGK